MKKLLKLLKVAGGRQILAALLVNMLIFSSLTPLAADDSSTDTQSQINALIDPSLLTSSLSASSSAASDTSGPGETPEQQGLNTSMQSTGALTDPMTGIRTEMVPAVNLTGAVNYSYRFDLPKGIGVQPDLAVTYSSDAQYGNAGWGWNLLTSKIEVKTSKNGNPLQPKYDMSSDILLINGQELADIGPDENGKRQYRLKNEGSFILVKQEGSGYKEMRPDGSVFYYGQSEGSRAIDKLDGNEAMVILDTGGTTPYDSSWTKGTYQWYLDKAVDKYGNIMTYQYERNLNALYPASIIYGYLKDSSDNFNGDYLYQVNLIWKNRQPDNQLEPSSYRAGFSQTYNRLLDKMEICIKDAFDPQTAAACIKYYQMVYKTGSFGKTLLSGINEYNKQNSLVFLLNSVEYDYEASGDNLFGTLSACTPGVIFTPGSTINVLDLNGDGKIDFYRSDAKLFTYADGSFISRNYLSDNNNIPISFNDKNTDGLPDGIIPYANYTLINTGNGFKALANTGFDPLGLTPAVTGPDFNGDGIPDKVDKEPEDNNNYHVMLGNGKGEYVPSYNFKGVVVSDDPKFFGYYFNGIEDNNWGRLNPTNEIYIDANGDGLADKITWIKDAAGTKYTLTVYLNTGKNFMTAGIKIGDNLKFGALMEMNGDNCPDAVANDGVIINKWANVNTLKKITNKISYVTTELEYQQSFYDPDRAASLNYRQKRTLAAVTTGNEFTKATVNYEYSNGVYDRREKEFRGYGLITAKVRDTDKNVTHIAETYYKVDDIDGYDRSGIVAVYDPYIKGKPERTVSKIQLSDGTVSKYGAETLYKYTKVKVFGDSAIKGKAEVQYVYNDESRCYIYNDQGIFLGKDPVNGDPVLLSQLSFDPDSGLLIQEKNKKFVYAYSTGMFSNYGYNEVISLTNYAVGSGTKWLNLPINSLTYYDPGNNRCQCPETIAGKIYVYNDGYSRGTMYDALPEVIQISENRLMKVTTLNNIGSSAETGYTYDYYGNIKSITDCSGLTTVIETVYRPNDRPDQLIRVKTTYADGLSETGYIDLYTRLSEKLDINNDRIRYVYDERNRLKEVRELISGIEYLMQKYSYNRMSDIYDYSAKWYMVFTMMVKYLHNPDAVREQDKYLSINYITDTLGRIKEVHKDSIVNGKRCWTVYGINKRDTMGRIIKEAKPSISNSSQIMESETDTNNYNVDYQYDNFGRLSVLIKHCRGIAGDYTTNIGYSLLTTDVPDTYGHTNKWTVSIRTISDGFKNITETTDIYGNLIKTEEKRETAPNAVTLYENTLTGYSRVKDPLGLISVSQSNILGELLWKQTPDSGTTEYFYNDRHLVSQIKEYGRNEAGYRTTGFVYDEFNRVTNINYPNSEDNVNFSYYGINDGAYNHGNLRMVTRGNYFSAEYFSDAFEQYEVKIINSKRYTTVYNYDLQGRIKELCYPDGETVRYGYNETGDLKSITGNQTYLEYIKYNELGQRTEIKYGNGNVIKYAYDPGTDFVSNMTSLGKSGTELLKYNYAYGKDLNLSQISDNPGGTLRSEQNYLYYTDGALKNAKCSTYPSDWGYNQTFTFDAAGRITSQTLGGANYTYNYTDANHAVDSIDIYNSADVKRINFTYDNYGNLQKKSMIGNILKEMTLRYNDSNELTHIDLADGNKLDCLYDAGGQRIRKIHSTASGSVIADTIFVNGFFTLKNNVPTKHISDGNKICATQVDNDPAKILYYTQGNLGSTNLLTDKDGSQRAKYLYRPFGGMHLEVDNNNNVTWDHFATTYRYAAYKEDQESNLFYLNARYFDAEIGQFLTVDPAESGLNYYGYTTNPIRFSDPTGMTDGPDYSNPGKAPYDTNTSNKQPTVTFKEDDDDCGCGWVSYKEQWECPPIVIIPENNNLTPITNNDQANQNTNQNPYPHLITPDTGCSKTPTGNSGSSNENMPRPPLPANVIINNILDGAQMALGTLGFIPGIGEIPDGINGLISLGRGDYLGAGLSLAAMIPFVGWVSGAGKIGKNGLSLGSRITKSNLKLGQQMHKAYKANLNKPAEGLFKEFRGVKGVRPDFVDLNTRTIYELKPNNPRGINSGKKQLQKYQRAYEDFYGGTWNTVLDVY